MLKSSEDYSTAEKNRHVFWFFSGGLHSEHPGLQTGLKHLSEVLETQQHIWEQVQITQCCEPCARHQPRAPCLYSFYFVGICQHLVHVNV